MNNKLKKRLWWGWLIWIPISLAIGFYGTTLQGGRYNVNQVFYLLMLPAILVINSVREHKGKKTHFWLMILASFACITLWVMVEAALY